MCIEILYFFKRTRKTKPDNVYGTVKTVMVHVRSLFARTYKRIIYAMLHHYRLFIGIFIQKQYAILYFLNLTYISPPAHIIHTFIFPWIGHFNVRQFVQFSGDKPTNSSIIFISRTYIQFYK